MNEPKPTDAGIQYTERRLDLRRIGTQRIVESPAMVDFGKDSIRLSLEMFVAAECLEVVRWPVTRVEYRSVTLWGEIVDRLPAWLRMKIRSVRWLRPATIDVEVVDSWEDQEIAAAYPEYEPLPPNEYGPVTILVTDPIYR